jgi:MOSC domain-containing protein YiiM
MGFSGVMVRVLDSGAVDPGAPKASTLSITSLKSRNYSTRDELSNHYTTETQDLENQRRAL